MSDKPQGSREGIFVGKRGCGGEFARGDLQGEVGQRTHDFVPFIGQIAHVSHTNYARRPSPGGNDPL